MSSPLDLHSQQYTLIQKSSWIIFYGYILLAVITYFLIQYFEFARDLFDQTEFIILINAVWFSLGIVMYGVYALVKNFRRAKLSNLNIKLDTQFLIFVAFFFFAIKQVFDLLLYLDLNSDINFILALVNTSKVLEFGGFMAGLASIYFGRKRFEE